MKYVLFPLFSLFFLYAVCPSAAQTLEFSDELFVVVASASPDTTFIAGDGNTSVTIDQSSSDFGSPAGISHGLIEFRDFALPQVADVISARLNFETTSPTNGPVNVYRMTEPWDESTTWNSLINGIDPGTDTAAEPSDSFEDIEEGPIAFDVTQIIQDWKDGAPELGIGLFNTSGDGWDVQTADDFVLEKFAPTLSVDVKIPPPTKLQIDPATGFAQIVSISDGFDFDLRAYNIQSAGDLLLADQWTNSNLASRELGDPNSIGMHWDIVNGSPEQLYEAFLFGGMSMATDEILTIGRIVSPFELSDAPELQFEVGTSDFVTGSPNTIVLGELPVEFVAIDVPLDPIDPLDCNSDGVVDANDLNCATSETIDATLSQAGLLTGDFDTSGAVDFSDFLILSANFGSPVNGYTQGDTNLDGTVNFSDFLALSANFGSASATAAVPEPSSHSIAALLVICVLLRPRFQEQRSRC